MVYFVKICIFIFILYFAVFFVKQLRLNYINNQKQTNKQTNKQKEQIRLVKSSLREGVVAKTDDEIYVLRTTKICSYFSFVFSTVLEKVELLKISKVMQLL